MENAADALKMAAAILIFIIAIASSFSLFGTAKQTADSIITMKDKQAYLAAAELDNGILYTSSSAIQGETGLTEDEIKDTLGVTTNGDRIVGIDDVVSTILRYNKEKYGVTIVRSSGEVLARFDSNTEDVMRRWYNIANIPGGKTAVKQKEDYTNKIRNNLDNFYSNGNIKLEYTDLEELYEIVVEGNDVIKCGAPWYGNDKQIQARISHDLAGTDYKFNGQTYTGKGLISELETELNSGKNIIEVTNEIDQSEYFKDTTMGGEGVETPLLAGGGYQMPTVEIVYIIY